MQRNEAEIRDALSSRLELLEPGLQLVEIEKYLPNPQGTRGFIDLFARDAAGRFVLIELKRSDAASREALHEVMKYLEAVKAALSARDSEIRILVVSTEWRELLVPFSSFVRRVTCQVEGFRLTVDENNIPVSAEKVAPVDLVADRLFAPWHEVNLYEDRPALDGGVAGYEASCAAKGIDNYVLIVMEAQAGFHEASAASIKAALDAICGDEERSALGMRNSTEIVEWLPEHRFLLYFATLQMSEEDCWAGIRAGAESEDLAEFESYVEEMTGEERLCTLHEKLYEVEPSPPRDYYEIGYPAKFGTKLLDTEGWQILEVRRYGTLRSNSLLADDAIVSDLRGTDGNSAQKFSRDFMLSSKAEVAEVRAGIQRCLRDNAPWRLQLLRMIDELSANRPELHARLRVFNPSNFCLTLYLVASRPDGESYVPDYTLALFEPGSEEPDEIIFGAMQPNDASPSFTKLLHDYYEGDGFRFLLNLNWGGYESRDPEIARSLGMSYKTFKLVTANGQQQYVELDELGWQPRGQVVDGFAQYFERFPDLCHDVCEYYATHWNGVMTMHDRDEEGNFRT
ncbi:MAG: hypothetical protein JWP60_2292 [Ramlibacter sp.]|nr:hypothetical protein [Ramlibacter sp.]